MNNNRLGSSETPREASPPHAFQAYLPFIPDHRRLYFDPQFLEWFVGFLEGDGSFLTFECEPKEPHPKSNHPASFTFRVALTQDDEALLKRVRTELGFGRVTYGTANDGEKYPQLRFDSRENVIAFIHLCAGNLRLQKVQDRFLPWAQKACTQFTIPMPQNPAGLAARPLSGESAWLSGFFQADGSFAAHYRPNPRLSLGYRVEFRPYVDQKGEKPLLDELARFFHGWVQTRNQAKSYYRVWFFRDLPLFAEYFRRFPVRGRKHIAQSRWFRVYQRVQDKDTIPLPEIGTKAHARFVRLVQNINACQSKSPRSQKFRNRKRKRNEGPPNF